MVRLLPCAAAFPGASVDGSEADARPPLQSLSTALGGLGELRGVPASARLPPSASPAFCPSPTARLERPTGQPPAAAARGSLARKRPLPSTALDRAGQASASLRCVLPGLKRLRRDAPTSPTSVGDVSAPKDAPGAAMTSAVAAAAAATSPASAKMQSMLRGLQHLAACGAPGCANALCVSTRAFVAKVRAHQAAAAAKPSHDGARCGACQLWAGILRAHAPACAVARCCVPGCSPGAAAAGDREPL